MNQTTLQTLADMASYWVSAPDRPVYRAAIMARISILADTIF